MSDNDLPDDEFQAKYSGPGGKRAGAGRKLIGLEAMRYTISFRVTRDQLVEISGGAHAVDMSLAAFCRAASLGR